MNTLYPTTQEVAFDEFRALFNQDFDDHQIAMNKPFVIEDWFQFDLSWEDNYNNKALKIATQIISSNNLPLEARIRHSKMDVFIPKLIITMKIKLKKEVVRTVFGKYNTFGTMKDELD